MTPPRLTQLKCPNCRRCSWVIDANFRGVPDKHLSWEQRTYNCRCSFSGCGWSIRQQSPPEFLLQPHDLYPMTQQAFDYWVGILRAHFPDHPLLSQLGTTFVPRLPSPGSSKVANRIIEMRNQAGKSIVCPNGETVDHWLATMQPVSMLTFKSADGYTPGSFVSRHTMSRSVSTTEAPCSLRRDRSAHKNCARRSACISRDNSASASNLSNGISR